MICPTPHKRAYLSRSEAQASRRRHRGRERHILAAYLCGCGRWHLATKLKHKRGRAA